MAVSAGAPAAEVDPRVFGFKLPPGELKTGEGRVLARSSGGDLVACRNLAAVGDSLFLVMPNGRIETRTAAEVQPTVRSFQPLSLEAMAKYWQSSAGLANFNVKKTTHYVYLYNTTEEFYTAASRILETMLPGVMQYCKSSGLSVHDPEVPLPVILFKTEEEFQKFQRMPPGVVAYYDVIKNYIVMREESKLADIKQELAVQQSLATMAHEGTHQILHNIGVQQRLSIWPMWIAEGLPEYLAPTSFGRNNRWKGAGQVNDLRMFELENFIKAKSAATAEGQMVEQTVTAARLSSTGYASAWALTHYLAKNQPDKFSSYLRTVSKLGPLEGEVSTRSPVTANKGPFTAAFGSGLGEMEQKLVAHLKKQPYNDPFAEYPHYVCTILYPTLKRNNRDANVFHTSKLANIWQQETLEKANEDARKAAQVNIYRLDNRSEAESFARKFLSGK